jgi:hypothetical protein
MLKFVIFISLAKEMTVTIHTYQFNLPVIISRLILSGFNSLGQSQCGIYVTPTSSSFTAKAYHLDNPIC